MQKGITNLGGGSIGVARTEEFCLNSSLCLFCKYQFIEFNQRFQKAVYLLQLNLTII